LNMGCVAFVSSDMLCTMTDCTLEMASLPCRDVAAEASNRSRTRIALVLAARALAPLQPEARTYTDAMHEMSNSEHCTLMSALGLPSCWCCCNSSSCRRSNISTRPINAATASLPSGSGTPKILFASCRSIVTNTLGAKSSNHWMDFESE